MNPPQIRKQPRRAQSTSALIFACLLLLVASAALADDHGLLLSGGVEEVFDAEGKVRWRSTTTNGFDRHGRVAQVVTTHELYEQVYAIDTTTNVYGHHGTLVYSVTFSHALAPGAIDSRTTTTYTNLNPHRTQIVAQTDLHADGTTDFETISTLTYDHRRRLIGRVFEGDVNGDGIIDFRGVGTWKYSADHRSLVEENEFDSNADGVVDGVATFKFALNERGDPISFVFESSDTSVYSPEGQFGKYIYDRFGNLRELIGFRLDSNGVEQLAFKTTYSYIRREHVDRDDDDGTRE